MLEVQWTTDGERVLSASPDRSVRAWDVATGEQVSAEEFLYPREYTPVTTSISLKTLEALQRWQREAIRKMPEGQGGAAGSAQCTAGMREEFVHVLDMVME